MAQWLRLCAVNAGDVEFDLWLRAKIWHAVHGQKIKNQNMSKLCCDFKLLIYELYTWKKKTTPHFMLKLFPAI